MLLAKLLNPLNCLMQAVTVVAQTWAGLGLVPLVSEHTQCVGVCACVCRVCACRYIRLWARPGRGWASCPLVSEYTHTQFYECVIVCVACV